MREEFPHYNLYVYSEGGLVDHLKKGHYDGIPVLFIPGQSKMNFVISFTDLPLLILT
jgi:hypothetical protein